MLALYILTQLLVERTLYIKEDIKYLATRWLPVM